MGYYRLLRTEIPEPVRTSRVSSHARLSQPLWFFLLYLNTLLRLSFSSPFFLFCFLALGCAARPDVLDVGDSVRGGREDVPEGKPLARNEIPAPRPYSERYLLFPAPLASAYEWGRESLLTLPLPASHQPEENGWPSRFATFAVFPARREQTRACLYKLQSWDNEQSWSRVLLQVRRWYPTASAASFPKVAETALKWVSFFVSHLFFFFFLPCSVHVAVRQMYKRCVLCFVL